MAKLKINDIKTVDHNEELDKWLNANFTADENISVISSSTLNTKAKYVFEIEVGNMPKDQVND